LRILAFIPTYNCEKQIARVLTQFTPVISEWIDEILIIDNASHDKTVDVAFEKAKELAAKIVMLKNRENYGYGGSMKIAIRYAIENNFDYLLVLHGDDQANIGDFDPILKARKYMEYDAVLGARFHSGSRLENYNRFKTIGNYVLNYLCGIFSCRRIYDLGSGLNMYKTDRLKDVNYLSYKANLNFTAHLHRDMIRKGDNILFYPISWRELDQLSNAKIFRQAIGVLWLYVSPFSCVVSKDKKTLAEFNYFSDIVGTYQIKPYEYNLLHRMHCVICEGKLEYLKLIPHFPVYSGVTSAPPQDDIYADMQWAMCSTCGTIQLERLMPLHLVYQTNHSDAVGKTWEQHNRRFADFIRRHGGKHRLEIGGGTGKLAKAYRQLDKTGIWVIVEPNPIFEHTCEDGIEWHQGWFDEKLSLNAPVDTVIHSHVMEHWYTPKESLGQISKILPVGGRMICSIPRLDIWLAKKYTNCLSFEHTYYIDQQIAEYLLSECSMELQSVEAFDEHSLFLCFEKKANVKIRAIPKQSENCRKLFLEMIDDYSRMANHISSAVTSHSGPSYIFGAHLFSQYMFSFGLNQNLFACILDNSTLKIGSRLYGTQLEIQSPECLRDIENGKVIINCGAYNDEIRNGLLEINPNLNCMIEAN
jgi:glycosyltransferase involved in cell wall biosynthesis/2-polyprenyl-3-methyl-5-hydroxy-6-metoxy-1,4-benzoquinol methylase